MKMHKWAFAIIALAGLAGAAGVIAAAEVAHGVSDPMLQTASNFLLFHAAVAIAIAAVALASPRHMAWFLTAASLLLAGCGLFCGDLAFHALNGARLFPMAAPIGGMFLIGGWVMVVLAALIALVRRSHRAHS
jgi:uncharacterized membrane protein YgdD (TMEM256/DUF423 family)